MSLTRTETDQAVVERARRVITGKRGLRWAMLALGCLFLGFCLFFGYMTSERLGGLSRQDVTEGFVAGFGLAVVSATFGFGGGLCIAKFLMGFDDAEFRMRELLVKYHDRLRDILGPNFK